MNIKQHQQLAAALGCLTQLQEPYSPSIVDLRRLVEQAKNCINLALQESDAEGGGNRLGTVPIDTCARLVGSAYLSGVEQGARHRQREDS